MVRRAFVAGVLVCLAVLCPARLPAQTVDSTFWSFGSSDRVFAIARQGNTIYIGGQFDIIGPTLGSGVPFDRRSGLPVPGFAKITGEVRAVVSDGQGGWFIGGNFSAIEGQPHRNIAHLTSRGFDRAWRTEANGEVRALVLTDGTLYVGGGFTSIGSSPRTHLAALASSDGTPTSWNPSPDQGVLAMLVRDDVVFVGGYFTSVGGVSRPHAAAIDRNTGLPTAWNPGFNYDVWCLAAVDSTVFAGGQFDAVGDSSRAWVAAIHAESGQVLGWDARLDRAGIGTYDGGPRIESLLIRNGSLFLAGSFTTVGGTPRQGLAAVSLSSGAIDAWDPRTAHPYAYGGAYFRSLAASGDTLFVSGFTDEIGGVTFGYDRSPSVDALSFIDGDRFAWDPRLDSDVRAMAVQGNILFAAGSPSVVGPWVHRKNLAAFDAVTGTLLPWAPEPNNTVFSLVTRGNTVYAGGLFTSIAGQSRAGVAALDGTTGQATHWNPGFGLGGLNTVYSLALWKSTILIAGSFSQAGGVARNNLAAADTSTGLVTAWDPSANDIVYCVAPTDSVIYAGGWFSAVGGEAHNTLVALDPETGRPRPWAPSTDGFVRSIATARGRVFIGGRFGLADGQQRRCMAAFDSSGVLSDWRADTDTPAEVRTLVAEDTVLYAGGSFGTIAGHVRADLGAIDSRTAAVLDWNPSPNDWVYSLALHDKNVYVGGLFSEIDRWPQRAFGVFRLGTEGEETEPLPARLVLGQSFPNPSRSSATIRFSLPAATNVTLSVFDLQGRFVARPLLDALETAGPHEIAVSTIAWKPGIYLYRLRGGATEVVHKMVVVQ